MTTKVCPWCEGTMERHVTLCWHCGRAVSDDEPVPSTSERNLMAMGAFALAVIVYPLLTLWFAFLPESTSDDITELVFDGLFYAFPAGCVAALVLGLRARRTPLRFARRGDSLATAAVLLAFLDFVVFVAVIGFLWSLNLDEF